jgi:hypothetical protein
MSVRTAAAVIALLAAGGFAATACGTAPTKTVTAPAPTRATTTVRSPAVSAAPAPGVTLAAMEAAVLRVSPGCWDPVSRGGTAGGAYASWDYFPGATVGTAPGLPGLNCVGGDDSTMEVSEFHDPASAATVYTNNMSGLVADYSSGDYNLAVFTQATPAEASAVAGISGLHAAP